MEERDSWDSQDDPMIDVFDPASRVPCDFNELHDSMPFRYEFNLANVTPSMKVDQNLAIPLKEIFLELYPDDRVVSENEGEHVFCLHLHLSNSCLVGYTLIVDGNKLSACLPFAMTGDRKMTYSVKPDTVFELNEQHVIGLWPGFCSSFAQCTSKEVVGIKSWSSRSFNITTTASFFHKDFSKKV